MKGILSLRLSTAITAFILSVACSIWAQSVVIWPPPQLEFIPPRNDNFADAILIQTNLYADTTPLYGGTAEVDEPMHGGQEAVYSRWWKWTAPTDGLVEIDAYPERIAVYTGGTLATLQAVELTEAQFNDRKPRRFAAQAGVEYYIAGEPGPPSGYRPEWMFSFRFEFMQLLRTPLASEVKLPPNVPVEIEYKTAVGGPRITSMTLMVDDAPFKTAVGGPYTFSYTNYTGGLVKLQALGTNAGKPFRSVVDRLQFNYPNDNFADALEIDGGITQTNIWVDLQFATSETNEPAVNTMTGLIVPTKTRWYRWRPKLDGFLEWGPWTDAFHAVFEMDDSGKLQAVSTLPVPSIGGLYATQKGRTYFIRAASFQSNGGAFQLRQRTLQLRLESAGTNFYAGDLVSIVLTNSDSSKLLRDVRIAGWPVGAVSLNYTNGGLITNMVAVNTGFATVTAYGYDENGEAVQSNPIFFAIRPANDLVERAIEIPAEPLASDVFEGDASYGALEAGEPPADSPFLAGSIWWKWTPNETGSRVIRPTLPFSIYTRPPRFAVFEKAKGDWIRVDDNFDWELHRSYGVYFDANAGTTYWIQAFGAEWTSTIKFRIESVATKSYFIAGGPLSAPSGEWKTLVTDAAGNLMDGEISVQTYAGTNESSLAPIGGGLRLSGPGMFPVGGQLIENVAPGTELYVQIRAWRSYCQCGLYARTFEAAEALGLPRGISPLGRVVTTADVTEASGVNALATVTMQTDRTQGTLARVEIRWLSEGAIELRSAAPIVHSYILERFTPETGWTAIGEATNGLNKAVFNDPMTNQSALYRTRMTSVQ